MARIVGFVLVPPKLYESWPVMTDCTVVVTPPTFVSATDNVAVNGPERSGINVRDDVGRVLLPVKNAGFVTVSKRGGAGVSLVIT